MRVECEARKKRERERERVCSCLPLPGLNSILRAVINFVHSHTCRFFVMKLHGLYLQVPRRDVRFCSSSFNFPLIILTMLLLLLYARSLFCCRDVVKTNECVIRCLSRRGLGYEGLSITYCSW
uniref:Transmembrane protein n=1 Tax=Rhipicephalus zambeziensis TaxID=60191 RepID=A0A224YFU7_9ACAR